MEFRVSLQPVHVLHTRPFQNTSLLVDLFTLDYGRMRVVAKGARREKSRFRSLLQLFQPLLASCSGRGELKTLTALECNLAPIQLQGTRLFSGLYMNELLTRLLHNQEEHRTLYRHYQDALLQLRGVGEIEPILRQFELRLLAELGYALNLDIDCRTHQPITADCIYRFDPEVGFEAAGGEAQHLQDQHGYRGSHIIALRNLDLADGATARTAKRLLREALLTQLGDKPLNSRYLFS